MTARTIAAPAVARTRRSLIIFRRFSIYLCSLANLTCVASDDGSIALMSVFTNTGSSAETRSSAKLLRPRIRCSDPRVRRAASVLSILSRYTMGRIAGFFAGATASALMLYAVRDSVWKRAELSASALNRITTEVPGLEPVQKVCACIFVR